MPSALQLPPKGPSLPNSSSVWGWAITIIITIITTALGGCASASSRIVTITIITTIIITTAAITAAEWDCDQAVSLAGTAFRGPEQVAVGTVEDGVGV